MKGISDDERLSVKESWDKIVRWATRRRAYLSTKEDVLASTKKVAIMGGG